MATAFLMIVSMDTLEGTTGFISMIFLLKTITGILVFIIMGFGSDLLIRGLNPGQMIGMKAMMSMWTIPMTGIICTTEGTLVLELQSVFL